MAGPGWRSETHRALEIAAKDLPLNFGRFALTFHFRMVSPIGDSLSSPDRPEWRSSWWTIELHNITNSR